MPPTDGCDMIEGGQEDAGCRGGGDGKEKSDGFARTHPTRWVLDGLTVNQVPFGFDDTDMGGTRDNWMNSSNGFPGAGMGFFFKEMRLR